MNFTRALAEASQNLSPEMCEEQPYNDKSDALCSIWALYFQAIFEALN